MGLFLLAGCYEEVVVDARVDVRGETARFVVQRQGVDAQENGVSCTEAAACVDAIRSGLAEDEAELAGKGASGLRSGVVLRGDELDYVVAYDASLSSAAWGDTAGLRSVQVTRGGRTRALPAVIAFDEAPGAAGTIQTRTTATVDGPFILYEISSDPRVAMWVLPRGRPVIHLEIQLLGEGGAAEEITPWVPGVPGLADALRQSGLVVDPAALLRGD